MGLTALAWESIGLLGDTLKTRLALDVSVSASLAGHELFFRYLAIAFSALDETTHSVRFFIAIPIVSENVDSGKRCRMWQMGVCFPISATRRKGKGGGCNG